MYMYIDPYIRTVVPGRLHTRRARNQVHVRMHATYVCLYMYTYPQVHVHEYASGSRFLHIARNMSRESAFDIQQALIEMCFLAKGDTLVRTSDSTFSLIAYALAPKRTFYIDRDTLTCNIQVTSEAIVWGPQAGVIDTLINYAGECINIKEMLTWPWVFQTT